MEEGKKRKLIFATRLALFVLFAAVLPFLFIAYRFDMFSGGGNFAGWGILGYAAIAIVVIYVARQVSEAMPWTIAGQSINGFLHVILPLLLAYGILHSIRASVDYLMQAIACTILCECIAIPVNPLPKWRHDLGIAEEDRRLGKFFAGMKSWWKGKDA